MMQHMLQPPDPGGDMGEADLVLHPHRAKQPRGVSEQLAIDRLHWQAALVQLRHMA